MVAWWNLLPGTIVVVAFGWDSREGFLEIFKRNQRSTYNAMDGEYGGGCQRSGIYWEISKRAKPKSSQRPSGSKKTS